MKIKSVWLKSFLLWAVFTLLCGGLYPLAVTLLAQCLFPRQAGGSLVTLNGRLAGSALLGQKNDGPGYFHPRPSACEYSTLPSGASNAAPTSAALRDSIAHRKIRFLKENGLPARTAVPPEMLCASGSGLDPHIGPEAACLQAKRVALERGLNDAQTARLDGLINRLTESRQWGFLGESRVNVFALNLMLDTMPEFSNFHKGSPIP
jgi:potassium-transporting ATPase KdpC subunit